MRQLSLLSLVLASMLAYGIAAKASDLELTCVTSKMTGFGKDPVAANGPVFTAELDIGKKSITWSGPGTFGKRVTKLVVEDTQYSWFFECDNSKGLCFKSNAQINRLTGNFVYMHVWPGITANWTDYEGSCKAGIKKKF